jgi:hypothetical protein
MADVRALVIVACLERKLLHHRESICSPRLAVTTVYLRRLEGQEDRSWRSVAEAIGA